MNAKVLLSLLLTAGLLFSACKKDEETAPEETVATPTVDIHELGHGDSHGNDYKATAGASLHMDVEIVAEGKIDYINIEMHAEEEEGHEDHGHGDEWELDTTFSGTGITGLKNLDFHKDLTIDETAEAGHYHFLITVVDMEGNSGSAEAEVEVVAQPSNIAVENLSINDGEHDLSKASGTFEISFDASVETGSLVNYSIEVHNEPDNGADEYKIVDSTFTAEFSGKSSAIVSETITVATDAPTGEYHVEVIVTDSEGNESVQDEHLDLED